MSSLIDKIYQLNEAFQKSVTSVIPLNELCEQLGNIIECNMYLFYSSGEIFAYSTAEAFHCPYNDAALEENAMPAYHLRNFEASARPQFNLYEEAPICTCESRDGCIFSNRYSAMVPIFSNNTKKAGILLIRYGAPFERDEEVLCEYVAAIISIELIRQEHEQMQREVLEIARANLAVSNLSFSEQKAAGAVLQDLEGDEGTVFLNTVANRIYATQSTISAALKKLESAGVISTKSKGVKGKHIAIRNVHLRRALEEAEVVRDPL